MKIVVLGSGSTVPHPARASSGFWVETSGGTIMLDFSAPMPYRMAKEGLDWPNLDSVWISHFHMDHSGGLGPFLAGTKHAPQMQRRKKPLRVFGPTGVKRLIDRVSDVHDYRLLEQPFPVEVVEVEHNEKFEIVPGVEALPCKTPHTDESLAIRIESYGKSLVYSSDTGFDNLIATLANLADLFILECTFLQDKPKIKHLELAEAVYLIRKSKCKKAMLTHFYPEWDDVNFAEEVAKIDGSISLIEATDGLTVEI
jgi:ribonuclease BN (tRNA processing enzyme)